MAEIFVISDTHFNHSNILDFKDYIGKPCREFDSVEQMNEAMLDNWVSVVVQKILLSTAVTYYLDTTKLNG